MLVSSLMLLKALVKVPVMSSNKLLFTTAAVYAQLPKFTLHKNRQFQTTNLVHYTTDVQLKYKVKEVTLCGWCLFLGESHQFMGAYHFSKYVFMCSN